MVSLGLNPREKDVVGGRHTLEEQVDAPAQHKPKGDEQLAKRQAGAHARGDERRRHEESAAGGREDGDEGDGAHGVGDVVLDGRAERVEGVVAVGAHGGEGAVHCADASRRAN